MTLNELTAQFLAMMNRSDLRNDTALATTFINQAIMRIQRELRVPFMEKVVRYTTPSTYDNTEGLPVPSDLLELIDINVDTDGDGIQDYPLQRVQLKDAMGQSEALSSPRVFARRGGFWVLGPAPPEGSVVEIVYYAEFSALVAPTDENILSRIAWDAVLYGALAAASDYYNDERGQLFEARYKQITQDLQSMADADELTGDAAVRPALLIGNYSQSDGW